jgi:ketosteroid isomerase-like protein
MSQENADIVRDGLERFLADRDTSRLADDFVWDVTHFEGWPDKAVYRGVDEFNDFVAMWFEPFDEWRQEIEQVEDLGGDRVLAIAHQHARLKGSTAEVDLRYAIVYTVEGEHVTMGDVYVPVERAFEAVGLTDRRADAP